MNNDKDDEEQPMEIENENENIKEKQENIILPENANETLYLKNLNEKVKISILIKTLTTLFSFFGKDPICL